MATYHASANSEHLAVVAIDFGTTFTGYAFSYRHDYQKIYTSTAGGKFAKDRFPTTVLLKPDKTLHSVGFTAEIAYLKLAEKVDHKNWFYFRRFKMSLYMTGKLSRDVAINDSEGRPFSAMMIFTMVIQHLKDRARVTIGDSVAGIQDSDIQWILTVPAIWSDSAKQFMREAGIMAGITADQLKLVLEPEAASLFCKEEPIEKTTNPDQRSEMVKLPEGSKYILADLGGGTADMCAHQIVKDGNLRELFKAIGDSLGGTCVDMAFQQFFIKLIGADTWMAFKKKYMDEFLNFMLAFETKKTTFSVETSEEEVFSLPAGLTSVIQDNMDQTLQEIIYETEFSNCVSVNKRNKLTISGKVMESFFKPTVQGIISLLREIFAATECDNMQTLLLVGGFSDSPYLREVIKSEFKGRRVIFPAEGNLAVLKGAVLMGYKPRTIIERRARFSYGFHIVVPFREGVHPVELKFTHNGRECCDWIFHKVIQQGQVLTYGQVIKHSLHSTYKTKERKHGTYYTALYKSTQPDPTYCTEEGCSVVGKIANKPPKEGWPDVVHFETHIIVGEAEFTVKMYNETTGEEYEANMDFL